MEKEAIISILKRQTGALFPDKKEMTHGVSFLDQEKIFYKIIPRNLFLKELQGYKILKKYYPVSNLKYQLLIENKGILIFEYEKTNQENYGLLVDHLSDKDFIEKFEEILKIYKSIFLKTLKKIDNSADSIFYKDRMNVRIKKYYYSKFMSTFEGKKVLLNGKTLTLTPMKIMKELEKFFDNELETWGVISQGDPVDLNIGMKPIFFDYLTGGYNYLMSEFANFYWANLIHGDYFAPLYQTNAFVNHEKVFDYLGKVVWGKNKMNCYIKSIRKEMIEKYVSEVLNPCFKNIPAEEKYEWYHEFKHFIALRIIGIFDLRKMSKHDQILSLSYLQLFFELEPSTLEELNKRIFYGNISQN